MPVAGPFADLFDAARGLTWPARRRARTPMAGAHSSVTKRAAAELLEFRPYRQGDDPRGIDWKLLARSDRVFVRLSPDRSLIPTVFILDASASMAFPGADLGKWSFGRRVTLALAAVARAQGDPVGLVVAGPGGAAWVPPRTRLSVLDEMIRATALTPAGTPSLAGGLGPALGAAVRLVLVSDFLGDTPAVPPALRPWLAAGGEAHAIHVLHPQELDPPGRTRFCVDPEVPDIRRPLAPSARAAYQRQFAEWRELLARELRGAGAVYTPLVVDAVPMRQALRRVVTPPGPQGPR